MGRYAASHLTSFRHRTVLIRRYTYYLSKGTVRFPAEAQVLARVLSLTHYISLCSWPIQSPRSVARESSRPEELPRCCPLGRLRVAGWPLCGNPAF